MRILELAGVSRRCRWEKRTPAERTRAGLSQAREIAGHRVHEAARRLGTGDEVAAFDTVPFCIWMVAHHGHDFEGCLWATASGMGDRDTTCAIVAGILGGAGHDIPAEWLEAAEPLPAEFEKVAGHSADGSGRGC